MDRPVRCLVAEDDPATRAMLTALLAYDGYEVLAVADGDAAWRALQAPGAPNLALLDWHMPGLDGPEIVQRLRAAQPDGGPWVAIMSGRVRPEDAAEALATGADAFVPKPLDLDRVRARLREAQNEMRARSNPPANR